MKYEHILNYVAMTPWAIQPDKMAEILGVLAMRAAGGSFTPEEIQARIGDVAQAPPRRAGSVAIVPLRGTIAHRMGAMDDSSGGMSTERFSQMFRAAIADESVGTVVIDVDSPGGTVPGVPEAADLVFGARDQKRIIAIANSKMASAAYWIASAAHEVVAIPSVMDRSIGSIGVFAVHQDLSEALKQQGVNVTIIRSSEHKAEGNPFEPLSDELKAQIQASVDSTNVAFEKAVARHRGVSVSEVRKSFGQGRAFAAADAKSFGLVDRIATFQDVVSKALGGRAGGGMRAEDFAPEMAVVDEPAAVAAEIMPAVPPLVDDAVARRERLQRY